MSADYQRQYGPLLQQVLAGEADATSLAEFEAALLTSPGLLAWLSEQLDLAALLRWQHAPPQVQLPAAERMPLLSSAVDSCTAMDPTVGGQEQGNVSARLHDESWSDNGQDDSAIRCIWQRVVEFANQPGTLAITVAALSTTIFVLALALITVPAYVPDARTPAEAPLAATITGTIDCEWAGVAPQPDLMQGERLELVSGLAEIRFDDGARVVLEGPATFDITSSSAGYLKQGQLSASVPPRAVGFAISTPQARVVDLGTEFAVRVDGFGSSDVHVFSGRTEVEVLAKSAAVAEPIPLAAGEALRIASVGGQMRVESLPAVNIAFVRSLTEALAHQQLAIGVDFQRGEEPNRGVDIEPQQLAGLVPQINWNVGEIGTRPLGSQEHPVIDSRGDGVDGMQIDWNSGWRGAVGNVDASLAGRVVGDFITSDRDTTNPDQPLKVTVTGLPKEYRRGGYSLICYRHTAAAPLFDAENTIRIDYHADGTIDDEATLPAIAQRTFRYTGKPRQDFGDFHRSFVIPEEVERFEIIVDAPSGKLATLSGLQIVPVKMVVDEEQHQ